MSWAPAAVGGAAEFFSLEKEVALWRDEVPTHPMLRGPVAL